MLKSIPGPWCCLSPLISLLVFLLLPSSGKHLRAAEDPPLPVGTWQPHLLPGNVAIIHEKLRKKAFWSLKNKVIRRLYLCFTSLAIVWLYKIVVRITDLMYLMGHTRTRGKGKSAPPAAPVSPPLALLSPLPYLLPVYTTCGSMSSELWSPFPSPTSVEGLGAILSC